MISNARFLILQDFLGLGNFTGGTLRLAVPAIILGFTLGVFIGMGRLSRSRWIHVAATLYVEFFRGVPLVMVIFWFWFIILVLLCRCFLVYDVAVVVFVFFVAVYFDDVLRVGVYTV